MEMGDGGRKDKGGEQGLYRGVAYIRPECIVFTIAGGTPIRRGRLAHRSRMKTQGMLGFDSGGRNATGAPDADCLVIEREDT